MPNKGISLSPLQVNTDAIVKKPIFIKNFTWSNTQAPGTVLGTINIPDDFITSNTQLSYPFKMTTYFRAKMKFQIQTAGTIQHQGILLCAAMPPNVTIPSSINPNFNYLLSAPHAFVKACESTPVMINAPMYVNAKVASTATAVSNTYAYNGASGGGQVTMLPIVVLNQLAAPTGSSGSVDVSVHVFFEDIEFFVPRAEVTWLTLPTTRIVEAQSLAQSATRAIDGVFSLTKTFLGDALDAVRGTLRAYTGLHSPKQPKVDNKNYVVSRVPLNLSDSPFHGELLDPYSDFQHGLCDDWYFKTDHDEMDISYILSKPQFIGSFNVRSTNVSGDLLFSRPITPFMESGAFFSTMHSKLAAMATHWAGDMEIILQPSKNMFQFFKLQVVRSYLCDYRAISQYPKMTDVTGLMAETLEFSGQEVKTVTLPYMSPFVHLPLSTDWEVNALQHGIYYIYLLQEPAIGDNAPSTIEFNVYLRCKENFQLFGASNLTFQPYPPPTLAIRGLRMVEAQSGGIIDNVEGQITQGDEKSVTPNIVSIRPLVHVRDLIRRFQHLDTFTLTTSTGSATTYEWDVATLIGGIGLPDNDTSLKPIQVLRKCFLGWRGGLRFKIKAIGADNIQVVFKPPGPYVHSDSGIVGMKATQVFTNNTETDAIWYENLLFDAQDCPMLNAQEAANYVPPLASGPYNIGTDTQGNGVVVADVEIPYLNGLDFVGSESLNYDTTADNVTNYRDSLGSIIVTVNPQTLYDPHGTALSVSDVTVQVWAAADDAARLGMQAVNYPVSTTNYVSLTAGQLVQLTPYNYSDISYVSALPYSVAPAAYYQR